jgi:hypothetical protein
VAPNATSVPVPPEPPAAPEPEPLPEEPEPLPEEPEPLPEEPEPPPASKAPVLLWSALVIVLLGLTAAILLPRFYTRHQAPLPASEIAAPTELPEIASGAGVPEAAAPQPEAPEVLEPAAPPEALAPAPAPAAGSADAQADGGGERRRTTRVITVAPSPVESVAAEPDDEQRPAQGNPTGLLVLRTVPSGAEVYAGGERLVKQGQGYPMPVGRHLLELRSPGGERTRIPLTIQAGETVEVCYSFDTNSACGG